MDYNGQTRACYLHAQPKLRQRATPVSTGIGYYWKVGQYVKVNIKVNNLTININGADCGTEGCGRKCGGKHPGK
jgi:hypothetical protein